MHTHLTLQQLHKRFNKLQLKHGEPTLDPIYGAGQVKNPKVCFIFMNPTARNISSDKSWKGLKAPWIGTKNIWSLFESLNLIDSHYLKKVKEYSPDDWSNKFAHKIYQCLADNGVYVTNLAKCTQLDARKLNNSVFQEYLPLLHEEISTIKPRITITFGNQVSSVILKDNISVSKVRRKEYLLSSKSENYKTYPVYYPVGQGMRNIDKALEDLTYILRNY